MRPTSLLLAGALSLLSGCRAPFLTSSQTASMEKWVNCDECIAGEREAVKAIGKDALPRLHELLLGYPSPAEMKVFAAQARKAYQMTTPVGVTEADFTGSQFSAFLARRQTRAAQSLFDIHSAPAKSILLYAAAIAHGRFRGDVANQVRFMATTWDGTTFTGTSQRDVQFGDSITFAGATPPLSPQALAILDSVPPFAAESMVYRRDPGVLVVAAAAATGQHAVAVIDGGSTRMTTVMITSDVDPNDRHTRRCATDECRVDSADVINSANLPALRFLTLKSVPGRIDTVDFFRIEATTGPLTVTARLDWRAQGPAAVNLDLRWRTCVGLLPTGNSDGSTPANKPEVTTLAIPVGQCRVLLVVGPTQPGVPTVTARLRITSP
jgi:hypothetical protein